MYKQLKAYKPRLSPAMVVAMLALIVASSMPAQAAIERLAKGSVGTAQLKDGAVTAPKIRDGAVTTPKLRYGAVTSPKIRNGSVALGDLSAQARPRLPRSVSARRDSWTGLNWDGVQMARLDLPAGRWLVAAKGGAAGGHASCRLDRARIPKDSTFSSATGGNASWSLLAPMLPGGEDVSVLCWGSEATSVGVVVLSAVEVR